MPAPSPTKRAAEIETAFGRFVLGKRIAVGGMAEIFLARPVDASTETGSIVVKRILPDLASDAAFVELFKEEVRISTALTHPNVVKVFGSGEIEGRPWLAMEYVEGLDAWRLLRRYHRAGRKLAPADASLVCADVLRGLEHVHAATDPAGVPLGIVHGDLSPSNVFVSLDGVAKIGDFGIARAKHRRGRERAEALTGKYGYVAPEQILGRPYDHRADLFSVGVILAELLLGAPLFTGGSKLALLVAVRDVRIEPLLGKSAELPPALLAVLLRALARDAAARFQSAGDFRAALESAASQSGRAPSASALSDAVHWALHHAISGTMPAVELDDRPMAHTQQDTPARTPAREDHRYVFFEEDGSCSEPLEYAGAVELLATGRISPDALVSVDDAPVVPIRDVEAFSRHLSVLAYASDPQRTPAPEQSGELRDRSVVSVLGRLSLARASGLVLFESEAVSKEVYLVEGRPEFVSSNRGDELFGEFLVRHHVISREELDAALARLPQHQGRLGESLIAQGRLPPMEVVRQIGAQVKEKLLELFQWRAGRFRFFRGARPPASGFALGLDPIDILCEGVRTGHPLAELEAWFASRVAMRVGIAPDRPAASLGALPPFEERVIRSFSEPVDLGSAPAMHPGTPRVRLLQALYLGIEAGLLVETEFLEVD